MEKIKNESVEFPLELLIAKPGDAKDMEPGTWTGAGGPRWLKFGKYVWRVLDVYSHEDQKHALLLAEEPVAFSKFDNSGWKTSTTTDIRDWLNNDFYRDAFSEGERSAIVTRTYRYEEFYTGIKETDSFRIFLLSVEEASNLKYFANNADRITRHRDNAGSLEEVDWWLRSPYLRAALVLNNGYVTYSYYHYYEDRSSGIRPALVVNLSSPIFTSSSSEYEVYDLITVQHPSYKQSEATCRTRGKAEMEKKKKESVKFPLGLLIAKPGGAKDMEPGTWTGAGGHRWLKFGKYVWRVLDVYSHEDQKHALLLAEEAVAVREFDNSGNNDWKTSDIRDWLNNDFYRGAFSEGERSTVVTRTDRYEGFYTGSKKTDSSRIFLLGVEEASNLKYFADYADRITRHRDNEGSLKEVHWWLRSPGYHGHRAALVYNYGYVSDPYNDDGVDRSYGIRPALVVNLSSPIFTSSSSEYEALYELYD